MTMFSLMDRESKEELIQDRLPDIEEFSEKERLALEKEMLGLYISGHPLEQYRPLLERMTQLTPVPS
jgi:DNA polymerase-3 subunit alpha